MISDWRSVCDRAERLEGARYRHLGRDRRNVDCIGLMLHAYDIDESTSPTFQKFSRADAGYYQSAKWYRTKSDALVDAVHQLRAEIRTLFDPIRQPRPGALLLMKCKFKIDIPFDHVGICLTGGRVIHAGLRDGVVITYYQELQTYVSEIYMPKMSA